MAAKQLSDAAIKALKPGDKPTKHFDGAGLYVEVMPNGSKLWRFKYRIGGKEKRLALGAYPEISLKDARERLLTARSMVANGIDPSAQRQVEKRQAEAEGENTFRAWGQRWLAHWRQGKSERHAGYAERRLEALIYPSLGGIPLGAITASSVRQCVQGIAGKGTLDLATRAHQMISQVFRFAIAHDGASRNPAADIRPSDIIPSAPKTHFARVDQKQLPDLLRAIEAANISALTRCAIRLLAHTFVRTSELIGAKVEEFDLEGAEWRIPAERMKKKTAHIVPLSSQAVETVRTILEWHKQQNSKSEYLFPTQVVGRDGHMSNGTILVALKRMGYAGTMTGHGFRGVASTILHEQGFPHEHIEIQLSHLHGDEVSRAYNAARYFRARRQMMQHWSDYLDGLRQGAKVKNLHEAA